MKNNQNTIQLKVNLIKTLSIILLTFFFIGNAFSQPPHKEMKKKQLEKIEKMKIAFFTKELDLTTEESEKFWPIYNELSKELREERKVQRKNAKELEEKSETLTDNDFKVKTDAIFESESKEAMLKKEYTSKIASVIGYKKAAKILSLEHRFRRELLNKINRPEHPPGPGRAPIPDGLDAP